MTYATAEEAAYGVKPVELYLFSDGNLAGSNIWSYTSSDTSWTATVGGYSFTFTPTAGLSRGELDYSREERGGSVDVTLPAADDVAQLFSLQTPATPIYLGIYGIHRDDSAMVCLFTGTVYSASFNDGMAVLTCSPFSRLLRARGPRVRFQTSCNWPLYSTKCGLSASKITMNVDHLYNGGTVLTSGSIGSYGANYFTAGWVEDLSGVKRFIVANPAPNDGSWSPYTTNSVSLMSAIPGLTTGVNVKLVRGCLHRYADCSARSNLVHFSGFDQIPSENPFRG